MRLELGSPVECSDAALGELADIVIDPTTRRVTHLVVEPHHRHERAQLVPIELASAGEGSATAIRLDCTLADSEKLPRVEELEYLRLGEFPVDDPSWDVGISEMLALPYYEAVDIPSAVVVDFEQHVTVRYDRVPKDEVEIRRASSVSSSDGHHLGHVDGFVVGEDQRVGHVVLEHGHLWGKREVAIPIGAVASVENDAVLLALTKEEVEALEPTPVHRWPHRHRG
jgi:uncharacterized protein YrrD